MTDDNRQPFAALMLGLGEIYGEAVSDARLEIYFAALRDLELRDIRAALDAHVRTSKWFPKPAEIREAIHGNTEDHAELGWIAVGQLVRRFGFWNPPKDTDWPDEATRRTALDLFGGWCGLCERLGAPGTPEFLGTAKQFKASFGAYVRRDLALPPGETGRELSADDARQALGDLKVQLTTRGLSTGAL